MVSSLIVPDWYREAKESGATQAALRQRISDFCKESAKRRGTPDMEIDPEVIAMTQEAYEHALKESRE